MDLYLSPPCRPSTLDMFANRRMIVAALRAALSGFSGAVPDVGPVMFEESTMVVGLAATARKA